ncbi:MAG TPA: ATP-dependent sacrificial sulfur transferase LarE [Terriglobales bacterium]|nr:ATP-dependent sacrificial sulfur transferase LarE [Terriglobales bacterium]
MAKELEMVLRECAPVLIAYSGGVDSAYLAYAAQQTIPGQTLAVLADSPSLPRSAKQAALDFAARHGIECQVISTTEMANPDYRKNAPDRCFFCKDDLFSRMEEEMTRRPNFRTLAYGVNADDKLDFRPGHRAAANHGVRAPLLEAGLGKAAIRTRARAAGLEVWDRPAATWLASRVAYGIEVTPAVLAKIEQGEEALYGLGFRQVRVRYHQEMVRLEIAREELPRALSLDMADRLTAIFKELGFRYVTLDLQGFRSGAMNEILVMPEPSGDRA